MSKRIAVVYGTSEGQTEKIANHISRTIDERGHEAVIYNAKDLSENFDFAAFDGVIIGASVHIGKYPRQIKKHIDNSRDTLQQMPSAFFSVSLTEAGEEEEAHKEVQDLIHQFLGERQWQPLVIGSFAGALAFSKYGFIKKMMMKAIAKRQMGDVDTSKDYEYTDWASVDEFVDQFIAHVMAASAPGQQPRPGA